MFKTAELNFIEQQLIDDNVLVVIFCLHNIE